MTKTRVLLGSPIRQKPRILQEFLASIHRLDQQNYDLDFLLIDDNEDRESQSLLNQFSAAREGKSTVLPPQTVYGASKYICNETTHYWKNQMIWKVAEWKDLMIQAAREQNYDYLFLIDSDLLLHPRTIDQLILADRAIISNIFWTKWMPEQISLPQVWVSDHYTLFEHDINEQLSNGEIARRQSLFLEKLRHPGVYEVGGLGACTLIARPALQKEISFRRIRNLSFWGEDRHFCVRAQALGLQLFVDTHYPAYHIYRDSDLDGVEEFKKHAS